MFMLIPEFIVSASVGFNQTVQIPHFAVAFNNFESRCFACIFRHAGSVRINMPQQL